MWVGVWGWFGGWCRVCDVVRVVTCARKGVGGGLETSGTEHEHTPPPPPPPPPPLSHGSEARTNATSALMTSPPAVGGQASTWAGK